MVAMKSDLYRALRSRYIDGGLAGDGFESGCLSDIDRLLACAIREKVFLSTVNTLRDQGGFNEGCLKRFKVLEAYSLKEKKRSRLQEVSQEIQSAFNSRDDVIVIKGNVYETLFKNGYKREYADIDVLVSNFDAYRELEKLMNDLGIEQEGTVLFSIQGASRLCQTTKLFDTSFSASSAEVDIHIGYFPTTEVTFIDIDDLEVITSHQYEGILSTLKISATSSFLLFFAELLSREYISIRDLLDFAILGETFAERCDFDRLTYLLEKYSLTSQIFRLSDEFESIDFHDEFLEKLISAIGSGAPEDTSFRALYEDHVTSFYEYKVVNDQPLLRYARVREWASACVSVERHYPLLRKIDGYYYASLFFNNGLPIHFVRLSSAVQNFSVKECLGYFVLTNELGVFLGSLNALFTNEEYDEVVAKITDVGMLDLN